MSDPRRIRLLPGAPEAVQAVREAGMYAVIITNQGGVGRGLMSEEDVQAVNARVVELLKVHGAEIDALYYCPHHPEGQVEAYRVVCECRKPAPGLLHRAADELPIDLERSFVIGDKLTDVRLAHAVGGKGILVRTGFGNAELESAHAEGLRIDYVADDVYDAVTWILDSLDG